MADNNITRDSFEWYDVLPGEQLFDPIGERFFLNGLPHSIKIGFGHNIRCLEIIAIVKSDGEDSKLKALVGKRITEE